MNRFYVMKEANTFSDTLECIGFASLLKKLSHQITEDDFLDVHIEDKHGYFELISDFDFTEENLENVEYFELLPFIMNDEDKQENCPASSINFNSMKIEWELYKDLSKEQKKESDYKRNPHYNIYQLLSNLQGYRASHYNSMKLKAFNTGFFKNLLKYYSDFSKKELYEGVLENYRTQNELKKVFAQQVITPAKGKGLNREQADSIKPDSYKKMLWFRQLLRFIGCHNSMTIRWIKEDKKNYALVPNEISFTDFTTTNLAFKKSISGKSSIKIDIILLNKLSEKLINHHKKNVDLTEWYPINKFITGLQFAYYKKLSQFSSAVTNIGFLGIPDFIGFSDKQEAEKWLLILEEHSNVISRIEEGNSSNIAMLQNYRDFFSASDYSKFFDFTYDYATFVISERNSSNNYIQPFTKQNMEELMSTQANFSKILENKGFLAIAEAIRNSTIIPIIHNNKKDVMFGLSQKFNIASRTSESLLNLVSEFIQKYNETVMLKDYHNQIHKKYVTTEEFAEFCKLLDEGHSSKTISGMLVAYGYSKEPKKEENGGQDD